MAYGKPLSGLCAATAVFACTLFGGPAPSEQAPAESTWDGPVLIDGRAGPVDLEPGQRIRLAVSGFAGNANITLTLYSAPIVLEQLVADAAGHGAIDVTVPDISGQHVVIATGNAPLAESGGGAQARILGTAVDLGPRSERGSLASTGVRLGALLAAGCAALVVGFGLVRTAAGRPVRR